VLILRKTLTNVFFILCVAVPSLLLVEAAFFYSVLTTGQVIEPADVVVVFHGAPDRNKKGYQLVNEGMAPWLMVSPATRTTRDKYDQKYARVGAWQHLVEDRADTTFQNALLAGRLIRAHRLKTVILVTDAWHMPRSYFLLKMMLIGSKARILRCNADSESLPKSPCRWSVRQCKLIYNETVEFWGSMTEMAAYFFRRDLPEKSLKATGVVNFLRKALLFEVDSVAR
jgi:hypothetical protein